MTGRKKLLLLGATGYLGGNIARHFAGIGDEVVCVVRSSSDLSRLLSLKSSNIRLIANAASQIDLIMSQEHFDWVINGVCTYKPNATLYGDMLESNVIFPLSVLNLAIKHQVKNFMTMGTGLPEQFNVYSFTKAKFSDFGRFLSIKDGINFADLRLEMFYGGWYEPDGRFLRACKLKLTCDEKIELTKGTQRRDIIRVEDILRIIEDLVHSDYVKGYRILPVGSGEKHSIREILIFMKEKLQSSSVLEFGAMPSRDGEPDTMADINWYGELGFKLKYNYFAGLADICQNKLVGIKYCQKVRGG